MAPTTVVSAPPAGVTGSGPFSLNEVLLEELRRLRPEVEEFRQLEAEPIRDPARPKANREERSRNLKRIYQAIAGLDGKDGEARRPLSALCLSGGGIRSATFNLGVLQALASLHLLDRFDYLSSVSGGGYISGWLKAWMRRSGTAAVVEELRRRTPDNPLAPEPRPIDRLREYSNYLTPRLGLFSADTWTAAALVLRNLILTWLVIMPALAALIAVPQAYVLSLQLQTMPVMVARGILALALALGLAASLAVHRCRHPWDGSGATPLRVMISAVSPLVLAAFLLASFAAHVRPSAIGPLDLAAFAALWCILLPLGGWSLHEPFWHLETGRRWPWQELLAMVGAGAAAAVVLALLALEVHPLLVHRPVLYTIFAGPLLLGVYLLARTLFVALASAGRRDSPDTTAGAREDADREWWARYSGLVLRFAVGWLALSAIALIGWHFAVRLARQLLPAALAAIGGVSGIVAVLIGKSGRTGASRSAAGAGAKPRAHWSLAAAAPVFVVALVLLLAHGTVLLGRWATGNPGLLDFPDTLARYEGSVIADGEFFRFVLAVPLGLLAFSFAAGWVVNTNRFSLHGLYRNRLIRAYLGASNPDRTPDPFTGFAIDDNLKLHALWHEADGAADCRRPLPIYNATLNLVRGERLAWQQRKAESFSMTPLFCGNFYEGYRRTREYGGRGGITLGTAMTISGAAANPNMGYHSAPAVGFLLTLLNGRLGAWLGNTNHNGRRTYRDSGPKWAVRPLFAEIFGLTSARTKYVNLSDGGHFDNLGLYEVVLRRCRCILVSDAGRDPDAGFEDLGNAIRKIRIDFGIPITFDAPIRILPRDDDGIGFYCALGTIRYSAVDGDVPDGTLVYVKPTLRGRGEPLPYDVFSYSRQAADFPHEPTRDQWFSESQFESYRALGRHAIEQIAGGAAAAGPPPRFEAWTLDDFVAAVRRHLAPASRPEPEPSPAIATARPER
ncbi:MAG TPA: patatin-like phospholipase family protein [Longimicrobiales bacterium]